MAVRTIMRFSNPIHWLSGAAMAALTFWMIPNIATAQTPGIDSETGVETEGTVPEADSPDTLSPIQPVNQANTSLSVAEAERLMTEASEAINDLDYDTAAEKLIQARETLNQLSNYYQELSEMFLGINTQLHQAHRENALETAQLRDQATYQLALVYRAQDEPDLAVPLLMEILRSQQPTRDLGTKAYQQLFELGFVDEPYDSNNSANSTTPQ